MAPIAPLQAAAVTNIAELFYATVGELATVRVQNSIVLGELSEPEPDIVLARRYAHRYKEKHPTAEEVFLLVEVADVSLQSDKKTKILLYAKQGIPEVWRVDVKNTSVKVYRTPTSQGRYKIVERFELGEQITSTLLADIVINVDEIF
jgi:Uma2 family endonuclease